MTFLSIKQTSQQKNWILFLDKKKNFFSPLFLKSLLLAFVIHITFIILFHVAPIVPLAKNRELISTIIIEKTLIDSNYKENLMPTPFPVIDDYFPIVYTSFDANGSTNISSTKQVDTHLKIQLYGPIASASFEMNNVENLSQNPTMIFNKLFIEIMVCTKTGKILESNTTKNLTDEENKWLEIFLQQIHFSQLSQVEPVTMGMMEITID